MNAETHLPYKSYESVKKKKKGVVSDNNIMLERQILAIKNYDYYLGSVIKLFEEYFKNTILIVTGDHGPKIYPNLNIIDLSFDDIQIDDRCINKSFGSELSYTVSAVVHYFGVDTRVNKLLNLLVNKVFTGQCDHQDLIFTLQKLMSKLSNNYLVTAR